MQAQLHKKYDLRSSRKRTWVQEQNEESIPREQTPSNSCSKGKNPLEESAHHKAVVFTSTKQGSNPPANEKSSYVPLNLPKHPKEQSKEVIAEKSPTTFNLHKDLEKVKISIPLIELLKQP